jgi:hypothetical protein
MKAATRAVSVACLAGFGLILATVGACGGVVSIGIFDSGTVDAPVREDGHALDSHAGDAVRDTSNPPDGTVSPVDAGCPTTGTDGVTTDPSMLGQCPGSDYSMSLDSKAPMDGGPTALLSSLSGATAATFGCTFAADPATSGKRYRMRAQIQTENATSGACLWFRADTETEDYITYSQTLHGTNAWEEADAVLDVPPGVTELAFGSLLYGTGRVWVGPITIEEVTTCVPTTMEYGPFYLDGGLVDGG